MDDVEKTARQEGRVVVYSSAGAPVRAVFDELTKKYGIEVEFVSAKGGELVARLFRERKAGLYLPDIYQAGVSTPIIQLKPAGVLEKLDKAFVLPELKDPGLIKKTWWNGELPWVDEDHTVFAFLLAPHAWGMVNTSLVRNDEIHSWYDLLDPKWKGRIVMFDPTIAGSASTLFGATLGVVGEDFWRQFVRQEPVITGDHRLNHEWVARGSKAVLVAVTPEMFTMFVEAGAPLALRTPREGINLVPGSGGLSLIKDAPHPQAAKLLINWILSREGQILYSKVYGSHSTREDVGTEWLAPSKIRRDDIKVIPGTWKEEVIFKQEEKYYKLAREIFAPLMSK